VATIVLGLSCIDLASYANTSTSTDYVFDETSLGGIGAPDSQSTNYQAQTSGGILGFGTSADATFQIKAGHETTNDPALAFAIDSNNVAFGNFSPVTTSVGTASFQAINYTSFGYVVQIFGSPPKQVGGSHTITALSSLTTSQVNTEQYGINLVANTSPTTFGANPNNGQFGYGAAESNYATANEYQYINGDTIADAPKSSGETIYTISYIVNVSDLTPGGTYSGSQTLICTGTY
jgi:hypothetical protein